MKIATSSFGPYDVNSLAEIVAHLDDYDDGTAIYVQNQQRLTPETLAAVAGPEASGEELENELGFRFLAEVDIAREAVAEFGQCRTSGELTDLLEMIEEYGI